MKKGLCILLALLLVVLPALTACGKNKTDGDVSTTEAGAVPAGTDTAKPAVKADISGYTPTEIADIVRAPAATDKLRDKDYVVDDEKAETLIALLDAAVTSPGTQRALGLDIDKLVDKVFEKVFSDATVNMIVQMLMPMVEREFQKVWVTIPDELEIPDVPTGMPVVTKANVISQIDLDDIEKALTAIDFYIFPSTLAEFLPDRYAEAKEKLRLATTHSAYDAETDVLTTAWEDAVLLDENGKLDLYWGVTDRESFVDAVCAALGGAEPLLTALMSNIPCLRTGDIGVGTGNAYVLGNAVKLDLTVNRIELVFRVDPNPGYNNALAPVFELFGLTPPDGNAFTTVRQFVEEGLLAPVDALLDTLLAAPLYTLLGVLPHLAYAVEAGLVKPLLSMVKTEINFTSNAYYTAAIAGDGVLGDAYQNAAPIRVDVGELVDLDALGLDVSSLNGLLGSVGELLGVTLPPIDASTLATLGKLTWHDSKRTDSVYTGGSAGQAPRIEGNRADVLIFMMRYLFGALGDRELIEKVLSLLEDAPELPDAVYTVLDRLAADPDAAIATVTELLLPQTYSAPAGLTWRSFTPAAGKAAALYTDYWTAAKADYMVRNLASFLDELLAASDMQIAGVKAHSLPELVDGIAGMIVSADTLNKIAAKIAEILSGVGLPEKVTSLVREISGIDLGFWGRYGASFADGDRAAFKQGVLDLIYPVRSLADYLLMGGSFTVPLESESGAEVDLISLPGYDAYTAGLIPLLEALGVAAPSNAALNGSSTALVSYVLDAVFQMVDRLKTDPIGELMNLLPGLLLFLRSGCLSDVMNNVLYSLDVLLETIRPVYDLDLRSVIDFDLRFENTDPVSLVCGLVQKVLKEKLGADLSLGFTAASLYDDLNAWTTESYTSANGRTGQRVNAASINKNDILTVIYDFLLKEILFSANTPAYLRFAKEQLGLSDFIYNYLTNVAPAIKSAEETYPGAGKALVFWLFFTGGKTVGSVAGGTNVLSLMTALMSSGTAESRAFASSELTKDMRSDGFANILLSVIKPLL